MTDHRPNAAFHDMPPGFASARRLLAAFSGVLLVSLPGCGYMFGSPHQPGIRTVHVPVFTSDTFRRGLEYQLTEAVQQQIKHRTAFQLTSRETADTILQGHLVELRKDGLGETRFDDLRELQLELTVVATWKDARTGRVIGRQSIRPELDHRHLIAQANMAPEVGQSLATATQTAVDRLAIQIVDIMEMPW